MLPIHERFAAFQGEGCHMGRAAFFIRTFGCPLHCPWCDSAGTWHPQFVPKEIARVEAAALAQEAADAKPAFVVVTGGEPAVHDLAPLTAELGARGLPVHLETSGAFPIKGDFNWITLSPKRSKARLDENVQLASEFKFIIEHPNDIAYWLENIVDSRHYHGQPVWLHPEWSHRTDFQVLAAITNVVKALPHVCRAGYQIHKLYRCDALDNRSAQPVPLGGNPALGY